MHTRANALQIRRGQGGQQGAPQHGLPALLGRHRLRGPPRRRQHILPLGPGLQPVGPVHLVLVEQVGQAAGQLIQAIGLISLQKAGDGFKAGRVHPLRQQMHQTPGQRGLVGGALAGHLVAPQHLPIGTPHETRRQLHPHGRAHAAISRQRHLQPLGHARALNEDDLFLKGCQRTLAQPRQHRLGQGLGAVTVQGQQTRLDVSAHEWGAGWIHAHLPRFLAHGVSPDGTSAMGLPLSPMHHRGADLHGRAATPQCKTPTSTRLVGVYLCGGVANGTRTHDNQNHNLGLYQLSYSHRRTDLKYSAISHHFTRPTQIFGLRWLSPPHSCLRSGTRPCTRA